MQTTAIPTLLVRGRESDVVTDSEVEHFRRIMPSAAIVDIGGAAHMVAGDRNDVFLNAIDTFLKGIGVLANDGPPCFSA